MRAQLSHIELRGRFPPFLPVAKRVPSRFHSSVVTSLFLSPTSLECLSTIDVREASSATFEPLTSTYGKTNKNKQRHYHHHENKNICLCQHSSKSKRHTYTMRVGNRSYLHNAQRQQSSSSPIQMRTKATLFELHRTKDRQQMTQQLGAQSVQPSDLAVHI